MAGAARSRGHNVTAAGVRAAPPRQKQYGVQLLLLIVSFAFAFGYPALWLGVIAFAIPVVSAVNFNKTQWPQLYATWDMMYMCERCGAISQPVLRNRCGSMTLVLAEVDRARGWVPVKSARNGGGCAKIRLHCRSYIPDAASVCRFCQRDVGPKELHA